MKLSHLLVTLACLAFTVGALPDALAQTTPRAADGTASAEPRTGVLSITANAACALQVGNQPKQMLLPDKTESVKAVAGEATIECASMSVKDARVKLVRTVAPGATEKVTLDLADAIVNASCSGKAATLADLGGGVLRHCVTRVDWTQADNGADIDWETARGVCAKRGLGWELPSADSLSALIDRTGRSSIACGTFTCNVSPHFRLTAPMFWAKDVTGPSLAMLVNLMLGGRHPALQGLDHGYRTLCVRPQ